MNCHILAILSLFGLLFCCKASRDHNKEIHSHAHWLTTKQKKEPSPSRHKSSENDEPKLHKKEEMLGQDMMRINEAEFKLQSLVSPEFHQGSNAINRGKAIGGMEVNTLSPEQVDFVQATSQWPKFSNPDNKKEVSKTIYPENPVLFPNEPQKRPGNNFDNNWITLGGNSFKQLTMSQYDMPMSSYGSMGNMNNMVSMGTNSYQEQPQQKATLNNMEFDIKPGYTTTGDAPADDKMSNLQDMNGIKVEAKSPISYGDSSRSAMSSLLNEGIMNPRGKPIGILGNILKASQEMPTGKVMKPSARSDMWFNAGSFSRRHKLERSQQNMPSQQRTRSTNLKHLLSYHKSKSKS